MISRARVTAYTVRVSARKRLVVETVDETSYEENIVADAKQVRFSDQNAYTASLSAGERMCDLRPSRSTTSTGPSNRPAMYRFRPT